jgi:hypothetical protein
VTRRHLVCAATLVAALGCRPAAREPVAAPVDLAALLPAAASPAGWRAAEGPVEYDPTNLYEVLDGGAERYLTYGFRRLLHVRYKLAGEPPAGVTLDLFDMGGELGAFGIYSSLRPTGVEPRAWGAEGYRSGSVAAAWRGSLFVHGEADDERPASLAMLDRLVEGACARAPGGTAPPRILAALPAEGLQPRSERIVAVDLLGLEFLSGGVLATYRMEGREARLFFSDLGSESAAIEGLASLRTHMAGRGAITREVTEIGAGGFRFVDPVRGAGVAVRAGRFVAGAHGDLSPEVQERLVGSLVERLRLTSTDP